MFEGAEQSCRGYQGQSENAVQEAACGQHEIRELQAHAVAFGRQVHGRGAHSDPRIRACRAGDD